MPSARRERGQRIHPHHRVGFAVDDQLRVHRLPEIRQRGHAPATARRAIRPAPASPSSRASGTGRCADRATDRGAPSPCRRHPTQSGSSAGITVSPYCCSSLPRAACSECEEVLLVLEIRAARRILGDTACSHSWRITGPPAYARSQLPWRRTFGSDQYPHVPGRSWTVANNNSQPVARRNLFLCGIITSAASWTAARTMCSKTVGPQPGRVRRIDTVTRQFEAGRFRRARRAAGRSPAQIARRRITLAAAA